MVALTALTLWIACTTLGYATNSDGASVDIVGEDNFTTTVLASPFVSLVEFHSGLCGSCAEFAPTWEELSWGPLLAGVQFVRVDIDEEPNLRLAAGRGLLDDGVPCIVLFSEADDQVGHIIMTGDHKLHTETLNHRIVHHLHLTHSASSKARYAQTHVIRVIRVHWHTNFTAVTTHNYGAGMFVFHFMRECSPLVGAPFSLCCAPIRHR